MLNEYLEFEAYVTMPESDTPRIQPNLLTHSFADSCELNGIEDILTTIARGFIFSNNRADNYTQKNIIDEQLIESTITILRRWCGFGLDEDAENNNSSVLEWFQEYPDTDGWLKKYWEYHFNKRTNKKDNKKDSKVLWKNVEKSGTKV